MKKVYCIIITFFLTTHGVFAGDTPLLTEIDALIHEKNYNNALLKLEKYINDYPEDFDQAQNRINKIMKERELYHKKAEVEYEKLKKVACEPGI